MTEVDTTIIGRLPLHELTAEYGETGLLDRLHLEIGSTDWDEATRVSVYESLDHALSAHEGTSRGKHPYSTHFLRVAIRILSRDHFAIRDRPALVIAALLHDTVEDHPDTYLCQDEITPDNETNQHLALIKIAQTYGEAEAVLVSDVTNPQMPSHLSRKEKNQLYQEHVIELLERETTEETGAAIIKLSDFVDNCIGLVHNESSDKAKRLAAKYLPLIPYMMTYVIGSSLLQPHVKDGLILQLEKAQDYCLELLDLDSADMN